MSATVTGFDPNTRDGIIAAQGGMCSMQGVAGCDGAPATEANHRLNRAMGGTSLEEIGSDPSNGCGTSHRCNWRLEHSSQFAEEGRRRGVKVEHPRRPSEVPMWSVFFRQWVVLRSSGMYLTGDTDSARDAREGVISGSVESGFGIEWKEAA